MTFPLATIERVCKLQFSQLFEPLFSIRKAKIALLEAELKAPGREVALLDTAIDKFGEPETYLEVGAIDLEDTEIEWELKREHDEKPH